MPQTAAQTTVALWRVRQEDATDPGQVVRFERLAQGIIDGKWTELDQVLGPGDRQWRVIAEHPTLEEYLPRKQVFRGSTAEEAEMDMTPMIDVVFQLLIFFMIAATYLVQKTLDMPKPEPSEEGAAAVTMAELEKNNIIVKISRGGEITVQGKPTAVGDLVSTLKDAKKTAANAELVLDVDDEVEHELVVKVLDAAGGAQIEKVLFVSRVPAAAGNPSS
jgi:biopolymer transport protein ExbD